MLVVNLHLGFSLLCAIFAFGVKVVFKKGLLRYSGGKKNGIRRQMKRVTFYLIFLVPIINILVDAMLLYMAICDDTTAEMIKTKARDGGNE